MHINPLINVFYKEIDFYSSFILFPLSFICEVNNIPIFVRKYDCFVPSVWHLQVFS